MKNSNSPINKIIKINDNQLEPIQINVNIKRYFNIRFHKNTL